MYSKFLLPLFIFFLSGCDLSPTLDNQLLSYINNLNRYEGLSIAPVSQRFPELSLPETKYRIQLLTVFDVNLTEFLSLQHCEIGYLTGKKNSVLGKVMTHSQRLIYETNIIRAIEVCDIHTENLKEKLYEISQIKRTELSRAFSNAIWGSEEIARFFSLSNNHLPMSIQLLDFQLLEISLNELNQYAKELQSLPDLNNSDLEAFLQAIYYSEYGGQLILTLLRLTDTFNGVSHELNQLKVNDEFCSGPIVFLKQQFISQYIERLQPYMAKINTTAYQLLTSITEIHKNSGAMTEEMDAFLKQFSLNVETNIWVEYQISSQQHAKAWDRLLRGCGVF